MRRDAIRFTLIELLVVVAIIAVLASMLLPALGKARKQALRVECTSRLKAMAIWSQEYREDHDDWFPVNKMWIGGANPNVVHPEQTGSYIDQMDSYMGGLDATSWKNGPNRNYLLCPGQAYHPDVQNAGKIYAITHISWGWRLTNYMISANFGYGNYYNQTRSWWPKKHASGKTSPDRQLFVTEIKTASPEIGYRGKWNNAISPHMNRTNMVMVDGHTMLVPYPLQSAYQSKDVVIQ